jgi:hypothetical protein
MDRDLSLLEKSRLRLHMLMCDACSNFSSQMKLIRSAMRQFPTDKGPS